MTTAVLLLVLLLIACVLGACVLSDALLQRLAILVRGAALEPRLLLTVRKIGYVVLVIYLFTVAFVWRRTVVDASANQLAVREQSRGDVHLTGSLVRLSLGGFRGVTTCYLWNLAMDKQMKNQLNELEVIVGWLTELQPHFNTPWLFQSWNLAYNVSNKTDRISDKYFYVTRGIRLLADGERQNHDDPDLRFELATTYQHKICQSDETNVQRSLFQLSFIPPNERDPARFAMKSGRQKMDKEGLKEFMKFCQKHPQLIRRLREGIHKDSITEQRRLFTCATPEAVVQFLAENYRIPSLYVEEKATPPGGKWAEKTDSKPDPDVLERFPVLPPPRSYPPGSALHVFQPYPDMGGDVTDESPYGQAADPWDAYLVARSWYSYSQEPLPAPSDEWPGENKPIVDPVHQHLNRRMNSLIFRQYPARAHGYIAERLEEEGWYDNEGWSTKGAEWFSETIGGQENWAVNAWSDAFKMWKAHGERNHILLSPAEEKTMRADADKYRQLRRLTSAIPGAESSTDPEIQKLWRAARFIISYDSNRTVSAFPHHYYRTMVEQDPKTVRARKLFYQAEALASTGSTFLALQKYQDPDALQAWATVLADYAGFREDALMQEESYEIQLNYLDVLNRALPSNEIKAQLGAAAALSSASMGGWFNPIALLEVRRPDRFPGVTVVKGPFDRQAADGTPWIQPHVEKQVNDRRRQFQPRKKDVEEGGPQAPAPQQPAPQFKPQAPAEQP
jgi:hypothetical protein